MMTDCTDFWTTKQGKSKKSFYMYKFNTSGLRYKIAICIQTGSIVGIHDPFLPGDWNDITIFS